VPFVDRVAGKMPNTEDPQEAVQLKSKSYEKINYYSRNGYRVTSSSHLRWRTDGVFEVSYCSAAGSTGFVLQRERIRYWSLRDLCHRDERRGNSDQPNLC
jgi:hypothetical protein